MREFLGGVGFFDSGIGGLSVLHACRERVVGVPFYYLGDNARAPYGNLPTYLIRAYTREAMDTFAELGVQAVVLACNTVTAVCADEMRKEYPFAIIGVEPAILPAARRGGKIGVLTTRATGESSRFEGLLRRAKNSYPQTEIVPLACDGLAQCIEEHVGDAAFDYVPYLPTAKLDSVVLGCTHYVLIRSKIGAYYNCPTFDGNEGVANRLFACLEQSKTPLEIIRPPLKTPAFLGSTSTLNHQPIFFLGARNTRNKHVYEQMFAKNKGKVVKNPKKIEHFEKKL